jgi:hypothetical protein
MGMALVVVAGAAGVWYASRGPRELTVDRAVENFRSQSVPKLTAAGKAQTEQKPATVAGTGHTPIAPAPGAQKASTSASYPLPHKGVYVFATRGYEETDALAGQRHDYPDESTLTIRNDGCTWTNRWQPLDERWEASDFCEKADGTTIKRYTMYHEFFQQGQTEDYDCDGYVMKPGVKGGESWTFNCRSDNGTATSKVTVLGIETINVGGQNIRAVHYRYYITAKGANRGTMIQERWLSDNPRLMVRETQKADLAVSTPFGPAGYKEDFRIDLKSVEPRT